jgi:nitrogen-specific signal transduction histidine kinase
MAYIPENTDKSAMRATAMMQCLKCTIMNPLPSLRLKAALLARRVSPAGESELLRTIIHHSHGQLLKDY